jgi:catalase
VNYKQIPVNAPKVEVHSYSKDGVMRVKSVSDPVYAPNSYGGPQADPQRAAEVHWYTDGEMVRAANTLREADDDYGQANIMVRDVLDDAARDRLVSNVAAHLLNGVSEKVLLRAFEYWKNIDEETGEKIEARAQRCGVQQRQRPGRRVRVSGNSTAQLVGVFVVVGRPARRSRR